MLRSINQFSPTFFRAASVRLYCADEQPSQTKYPTTQTVWLGGLPPTATKEDISGLFESAGRVVNVNIITNRFTGASRGFAFVSFENEEMANNAVSKTDYSMNGAPLKVSFSLGPRTADTKGRRVFVGNLSYRTTKETLTQAMQKYGTVQWVSLPIQRETGRSKGFGFVVYEDRDSAEKALAVREVDIDGRLVHVEPAIFKPQTPRNRDGDPFEQKESSF